MKVSSLVITRMNVSLELLEWILHSDILGIDILGIDILGLHAAVQKYFFKSSV